MPGEGKDVDRNWQPLERILIRIRLSEENNVASWRPRIAGRNGLGIRVSDGQPVVGIGES